MKPNPQPTQPQVTQRQLTQRQSDNLKPRSRVLALVSLMLAGEAIFGLPFHVSRYFRPAFVEVFGVSQTELGLMGSLYGAVATVSYPLGGRLADRFSARVLLCFALVIT